MNNKDNKNTFFVTTPIYYTNGIPHIGHSYSSIIADTLARYNKINWKKVKFSTWVDENSQKAVIKAEEQGMEVMPYLDKMADIHKWVWDGMKIDYTDFIRTTDPAHHEFVRSVLQKSFDNGDIYEGEYEGLYCVWCEAFKKEDDLIEVDGKKICPDHLTEPDKIKEKNYFFKLSKYQKFLEEFYENNPDFVTPSDRFNEVKAFVKRWLEDFSISRETNKFGIKLPFDESQVTYVWYDALFNYLTVCQNGQEEFWPADLHVVGKDIIKFHAIYWPAMLKSAGYELPKQILTTGFFTINGQKIWKSLWNAIDPVEFSEQYSKDLIVLYLLSSFNIGQDWDFDKKQAILTYNAKLANNLWNLLNRVLVLTLKLWEEELSFPDFYEQWDYSVQTMSLPDVDIFETYWHLSDKILVLGTAIYDELMSEYKLKNTLDLVFKLLDDVNKYVDENEPWKLVKAEEDREDAKAVLYTIAEGLRISALMLYSFFPEKMWELLTRLGLTDYVDRLNNGELEELLEEKEVVFKITEKWTPLYARFDIEEK